MKTATGAIPQPTRRLNYHKQKLVPVPGRPPKSGARALSKLIREQTLDRRTWICQQYELAADRLASDSGGWGYLTAREQSLVWLAAGLLVELQVRQNYRLRELQAGRLVVGDSDKHFGWLYNSYVRCLQLLGVRPDKIERIPSLAEYIEQRSRSQSPPVAPDCAEPHADGDGQGEVP